MNSNLAARTALGAAVWAALPLATASDMSHHALLATAPTAVWGLHLIPTLILLAALTLSLEILDHTLVSRPLAATVMGLVWLSALNEQLQMMSLLAALVAHGLYEFQREWARGFPTLRELGTTAHKSRIGTRFWLRVFAWSAALATSTALAPVALSSQSSIRVVLDALSLSIYCESAEVLLVLYFTTKTTATYAWRTRRLLWAISLCLGVLYKTTLLGNWAMSVARYVPPVALALVLAIATVVAVVVEWPHVMASIQRTVRSLAMLVSRSKKASATPRTGTGQRRSFLYRAGSDVEVVGMATHYEAYYFRHNHDEPGHARVG